MKTKKKIKKVTRKRKEENIELRNKIITVLSIIIALLLVVVIVVAVVLASELNKSRKRVRSNRAKLSVINKNIKNKSRDNLNNKKEAISNKKGNKSSVYSQKMDEEWNIYVDKINEFSFKIPRQTYNETTGKYDEIQVLKTGAKKYAIQTKNDNSVKEGFTIAEKVMSKNQLQQLVKTRFGEGCQLTENKNTKLNTSLYKAHLTENTSSGKTCSDTSVVVLYDSVLNKAVLWNVNEKCSFKKSAKICYEEPVNTFKFLKK